MSDFQFDRLVEAKERKHQLHKAQRRQELLRARVNEQEMAIIKLEVQLDAEQADVDKLTGMSVTNLFHTLLRSKQEQLETERQQVLAAALQLQEAKQGLIRLKEDIRLAGDEIASCMNAEQEYVRLLGEKEAALRSLPEMAQELAGMEDGIAEGSVLSRELREAVTAGTGVLSALDEALQSLNKASSWGNWDLWGGGGLISTHLKHGHMDDAKQAISEAIYRMRSFRDELEDLKQSVDIQIDISSLLKFGDYWFDGLITDWIVQKRVNEAQERAQDARTEVSRYVRKLQSELTNAESGLEGQKSRRVAWIEQQQLQ
ncbi:hypothetical protein [Paenibacillus sp. R14(2021)]|uniref:hypothetical protein n=1 Tax=Paenibacillus sp. R14(2021) TaxID=2859228 RepID=UPI001C6137E4|nr:hypothetical protein [Paenibacillus sp. R14(2021)]